MADIKKGKQESASGVGELEFIGCCLRDAKRYGLEAEIVWSALQYAQEHPTAKIIDAIQYGFDEWVK